MAASWSTIDCDVHANVPGMKALRALSRPTNGATGVIRPRPQFAGVPSTIRRTLRSRRAPTGAASPASLPTAWTRCARHALDPLGAYRFAICNCLYGVQPLYSADLAAELAQAINDWIAQEWLDPRPAAARLDRDADAEHRPRGRRDRTLRGGPALRAGAGAGHGRDTPWQAGTLAGVAKPPSATACRLASMPEPSFRHPVTTHGWPSYYANDIVVQAHGFQAQLAEPRCEGVFTKYPSSGWC